jgi:hypothetical protein
MHGGDENKYRILIRKLERKGLVGNLDANGGQYVNRFKEKQVMKMCNGSIWLRIRYTGGLCEHSNEISCSIKGEDFIDWLSECYLLKTAFAASVCKLYLGADINSDVANSEVQCARSGQEYAQGYRSRKSLKVIVVVCCRLRSLFISG